MKSLFLSLVFSLLTLSSITAQNDTKASPNLSAPPPFSLYPERIVYEMFDIEKPPAYPGGEKELLKYLMENIKYPPQNRENNIISMIVMTFVIDTDGSVTEKKVIRGIEIADSILIALDQMPRWSPGMKDGQPVPVRFTLPIRLHWE